MKVVMVIPTYWGRSRREPLNLEDVVYDHPTPVDKEGTLRRALESLGVLKNKQFEIIVLGAASHPAFKKEAEEKISKIVADFKDDWQITQLSFSDIDLFKKHLRGKKKSHLTELISLFGYSNVRNMCLVAAHLKGAEVVILFDDDEVLEDPAYIDKAVEFVGRKHKGKFVGGVAGYYVRAEGGYVCPETKDWWWLEWQGSEKMNEAFCLIGQKPRLKETPFAFGGNMVIHRDVFTEIPFDPLITRGEDIDYLVNAKMFGYDFFLDNELNIRHFPPKGRVPDWLGFRQNAYRFSYMRAKLKSQRKVKNMRTVSLDELQPYPGRFLGDDLDEKIYKTSVLLGLKHLLEGDQAGFEESLNNIEIAKRVANPDFDPFRRLCELQEAWEELMEVLSQADELKAYLEGKIAGKI